MPIPLTILEEHHEAFPVWVTARNQKRIPAENNALLHIDEHADMAVPSFQEPVKNWPTDWNNLYRLTFEELSIANFIYAAIYIGLIDEMVWLQHGAVVEPKVYHVYSSKREGKVLRVTKDIKTAGLLSPERKHFTFRKQRLQEELPSFASVLLDIDLDYFSCADPKVAGRIEVTAEEYHRYTSNRYHQFRLQACNLFKPERQDDKFYFHLNFDTPSDEPSSKVSEAIIVQRLDQLQRYLEHHKIQPVLITVCRSKFSGYTPADQCDFIQEELLKRLNSLYGLAIKHVAEVGI